MSRQNFWGVLDYSLVSGVRVLRRRWAKAITDITDCVSQWRKESQAERDVARLESFEPRVMMSGSVIDNGDAGYSVTAGWISASGQGYQGDVQYVAKGDGTKKATWMFEGLTPGVYSVGATWSTHANRATDAPFTVKDEVTGEVLANKRLNQEIAPNDFSDGGASWELVGDSLIVFGDKVSVTLSNDANDYVIADGVRLERTGDLPADRPELLVTVGGAVQASGGGGEVALGDVVVGGEQSRTYVVRNVGSAPLTLGAGGIVVPDGFKLAEEPESLTIAAGGSLSFTVERETGEVGSVSGVVSFTSNDADESKFEAGLSSRVTGAPVIIDNKDVGFTTVGSWTNYSGQGLNGTVTYAAAGDGSKTATWTFTGLSAGIYEVATTWSAQANRATNAAYVVRDVNSASGGGVDVVTTQVNQEIAPGDFVEGGVSWKVLGANVELNGSVLTVTLSNAANEYVIADAVRVVKVGAGYSEPEIEVSLAGTPGTPGSGSGNVVSGAVVDLGGVTVGSVVTRTLTIRNAGIAELNVYEIALPAGMKITSGFDEEEGLVVGAGKSVDVIVELEAGEPGADSGVITLLSNDYDEGQFELDVTWNAADGAKVIDDGDAGFSTTTGWTIYAGQGLGNDVRYTAAGDGSKQATWTFTDLEPGIYRVSATWSQLSNRATNAPYTVTDTANPSKAQTVLVNQEVAPGDLVEGGIKWEDLAQTFEVTGTTLTVVLSNAANEYVIADGVRVQRVGLIPVAADLDPEMFQIVPVFSGVSEGIVYEGEAVQFIPISEEADLASFSELDFEGLTSQWVLSQNGLTIFESEDASFLWDTDVSGKIDVALTLFKSGTLWIERTYSFDVTDVAPVVSSDLDFDWFTIEQGREVRTNFFISDPGTETVEALIVDWGDGQVDTYEGEDIEGEKSHVYGDNHTSVIITATVVNEDGSFSTSVEKEVFNAVPVAVLGLGGEALEASEGEEALISFGDVDDAAEDLLEGLTFSFDLDNDGVWDYQGPLSQIKHTFAKSGSYLVTGRVTDQHGASDEFTAEITVADVAPTIGVEVEDSKFNEGSDAVVKLSAFDPGGDTVNRWDVDWGDGIIDTFTDLPVDGLVAHRYLDVGSYEVKVAVTQGEGVFEAEPVHVEVENVLGTASITAVRSFKVHGHLQGMYVGSELNFILDWSDAGFGEPEGWEINWGDGNVELIEGNPQFVTHVYNIAGGYTPVARLIDQGEYSLPAVSELVQIIAPPELPATPEFTLVQDFATAGRMEVQIDSGLGYLQWPKFLISKDGGEYYDSGFGVWNGRWTCIVELGHSYQLKGSVGGATGWSDWAYSNVLEMVADPGTEVTEVSVGASVVTGVWGGHDVVVTLNPEMDVDWMSGQWVSRANPELGLSWGGLYGDVTARDGLDRATEYRFYNVDDFYTAYDEWNPWPLADGSMGGIVLTWQDGEGKGYKSQVINVEVTPDTLLATPLLTQVTRTLDRKTDEHYLDFGFSGVDTKADWLGIYYQGSNGQIQMVDQVYELEGLTEHRVDLSHSSATYGEGEFFLVAWRWGESSAASGRVEAEGLPTFAKAPTEVEAVSGVDGVELRWTDNEEYETYYHVYYKPSEGEVWHDGGVTNGVAGSGTQMSMRITGLAEEVVYDFAIKAQEWSAGVYVESKMVYADEAAADLADMGKQMAAKIVGFDTVHVMWVDRSAHEDGYLVEVSTDRYFGADKTVQHKAQGSSFDVEGLELETDYYFRVRMDDRTTGEGIGGSGDGRYNYQTGAMRIEGIQLKIKDGSTFVDNDVSTPRPLNVMYASIDRQVTSIATMNLDGVQRDVELVPIQLEIPEWLDPVKALVTFTNGSQAIRLFAQPGRWSATTQTSAFNSDEIIASGQEYALGDILARVCSSAAQGANNSARRVVLYAASTDGLLDPKSIEVAVRNAEAGGSASDSVAVTASVVDLDIDSNNDNGFDVPDPRSEEEDKIENDASLAGKVILANGGDRDFDGKPDYKDWHISGSVPEEDGKFVPIVVDLSKMKMEGGTIRFDYDGNRPMSYEPGSLGESLGHIRIWLKDASEDRNPETVQNAGDYIDPEHEYSVAELFGSETTKVFYVEGVRLSTGWGSETIKVSVTPAGGTLADVKEDQVRLTVVSGDIGFNIADGNVDKVDGVTPQHRPSPDVDFVIDGTDDLYEESDGLQWWWSQDAAGSKASQLGLSDLVPFRVDLSGVPGGGNGKFKLKLVDPSGISQIDVFDAVSPSNNRRAFLQTQASGLKQVNNAPIDGVGADEQSVEIPMNKKGEYVLNLHGSGVGSGWLEILVQIPGGAEVVVDRVKIEGRPVQDFWSLWSSRGVPNQVITDYPVEDGAITTVTAYRNPQWVPDGSGSDVPGILSSVDATNPLHKKVLVYMHGYNVSMEGAKGEGDALFKSSFWTGFRGALAVITWEGDNPGAIEAVTGVDLYFFDSVKKAFLTAPAYRNFLLGPVRQFTGNNPENVDIMAHSLGNLVMYEALRIHEVMATRAGSTLPDLARNMISVEAAVWQGAFAPEGPLGAYSLDELKRMSWRSWFVQVADEEGAGVTRVRKITDSLTPGGMFINSFNQDDYTLAGRFPYGGVNFPAGGMMRSNDYRANSGLEGLAPNTKPGVVNTVWGLVRWQQSTFHGYHYNRKIGADYRTIPTAPARGNNGAGPSWLNEIPGLLQNRVHPYTPSIIEKPVGAGAMPGVSSYDINARQKGWYQYSHGEFIYDDPRISGDKPWLPNMWLWYQEVMVVERGGKHGVWIGNS